MKTKLGADARIVLDIAPEYAVRAKVTFVAPEAQFTPKQVETRSERDKLMFRVKLSVPQERILAVIERIKTGIRGVGYVRLDDSAAWPERLDRPFPGLTARRRAAAAGKPAAAPYSVAEGQAAPTPRPETPASRP